jgi:hypothetical protein
LMSKMDALHLEMPPADAAWIESELVHCSNGKEEGPPSKTSGWLVKDLGDTMIIATTNGRYQPVGKAAERFWTHDAIGSSAKSNVKRSKIEDEVDRIEKYRQDGASFELDPLLIYGPNNKPASGEELVLGYRLHAAGKDASAARILFPALDTLFEDDLSICVLYDHWKDAYGRRMNCAFVGDRDIAQTAKLAKIIVLRYPDSPFRGLNHRARFSCTDRW